MPYLWASSMSSCFVLHVHRAGELIPRAANASFMCCAIARMLRLPGWKGTARSSAEG